jgi:hypothetical protein
VPKELKRAIHNSVIITLVAGVVVNFQGENMLTSLLAMLYSFVIITPALWLSYWFTQKLLQKRK